uniref:Uncharacterized protein n=1 Tax=Pararge aegeria TaxID=116150 RepID=S4PXK8_9NEOP
MGKLCVKTERMYARHITLSRVHCFLNPSKIKVSSKDLGLTLEFRARGEQYPKSNIQHLCMGRMLSKTLTCLS